MAMMASSTSRHHCVLARDGIEDHLRRDPERGELAVADLDEHALRHIADEGDFAHILDAQQCEPHRLRVAFEVGPRRLGRGQHVDGGVDVAVLVVEKRTDHALRKLAATVGQLLAHLIPSVGGLPPTHAILQLHGQHGCAWTRVGAHVIELRKLLQPLLQRVGDEALHVLGRAARPGNLDDHGLDGKRGVLGASELRVGPGAGERRGDDQEQDERGMADGPGR
jgi:hypothetical protein